MPLSDYLKKLILEVIKNLPEGKAHKPVEIVGASNFLLIEEGIGYDKEKYDLVGGIKENDKEYLIIMIAERA